MADLSPFSSEPVEVRLHSFGHAAGFQSVLPVVSFRDVRSRSVLFVVRYAVANLRGSNRDSSRQLSHPRPQGLGVALHLCVHSCCAIGWRGPGQDLGDAECCQGREI